MRVGRLISISAFKSLLGIFHFLLPFSAFLLTEDGVSFSLPGVIRLGPEVIARFIIVILFVTDPECFVEIFANVCDFGGWQRAYSSDDLFGTAILCG